MAAILNDFLEATKKEGVVINYAQVTRDGKLLDDWSRLAEKARLHTYSVAKSFTSIGVGIAMDEGLIELDEKVCESFAEFLPEDPPENLTRLTVRHLLTMTSGLEGPLFFGDDQLRFELEDFLSYYFRQPFPYKPGERFLYSNFNTYLLSCLIEKRSGQNLRDYLVPRLFAPLGIINPDWFSCPRGHCLAANNLYLKIDDYTAFGSMILNEGRVGERQIVSSEYIRMATSNRLECGHEENGYGFQFWVNPDKKSAAARGKYGQFIMALPDKKAVISIMSLDNGEVFKLVWDHIAMKL